MEIAIGIYTCIVIDILVIVCVQRLASWLADSVNNFKLVRGACMMDTYCVSQWRFFHIVGLKSLHIKS